MASLSELVQEHFVVMFTTRHCVDCAQAKELISHYFTDVKVYDVDAMENGELIRSQVNTMYSKSKVPAIFINGDFVGDLSDIQGLEKSGVLKMRIRNWKKSCPDSFPQSPVKQVRSF